MMSQGQAEVIETRIQLAAEMMEHVRRKLVLSGEQRGSRVTEGM